MGRSVPPLAALLEVSSRLYPKNVAVRDSVGGSLSYEELNDATELLCGRLAAAGVIPGCRVGICLPKSNGSVISLFATLKAGGAYVPTDYTAPPNRNAYIMADCRVSAIIGDPKCIEGLVPALPQGVTVQVQELDDLGEFATGLRLAKLDWPDGDKQESQPDLAYILYTSGSTGKPKGVVHTHQSALSFINWASREVRPTSSERFSSHAPFHFDLSIFDLYVPIKHGATVVLIGEELGKQPLRLATFLIEQKITIWYSTPSILRLLIDFGRLEQQPEPDVRIVVFAGEVFPLKYLRRLQEIWPRAAYYNFYGPTETNVCTYFPVPLLDDPPYSTVPIGYTCSDDEGRVVDEAEEDVPDGAEGELVICGGSVMKGYWNLPERNARAFIVDAEGRRWYRTGDVVRHDRELGYQYLGRRDRMVKRRGYRVELGEIEACLYNHEHVAEVAVLAHEDEESGVRIEAIIAWSGPSRPSQIGLKTYSAANLPAYMVPDSFVFLDQLPKTSTDKIDYQRLRAASDRPHAN